MKSFSIKDHTDTLPNYGYIEVHPTAENNDDSLSLEVVTKTILEIYIGFKQTAMSNMLPQFFDVLFVDEKREVKTKFAFVINPHNSTDCSCHLTRIQVDSNILPMRDAFRDLPDDLVTSVISHALGLLMTSQE
jgi:hypothetical protein